MIRFQQSDIRYKKLKELMMLNKVIVYYTNHSENEDNDWYCVEFLLFVGQTPPHSTRLRLAQGQGDRRVCWR